MRVPNLLELKFYLFGFQSTRFISLYWATSAFLNFLLKIFLNFFIYFKWIYLPLTTVIAGYTFYRLIYLLMSWGYPFAIVTGPKVQNKNTSRFEWFFKYHTSFRIFFVFFIKFIFHFLKQIIQIGCCVELHISKIFNTINSVWVTLKLKKLQF